MYYDPTLGRQGNIEKALRENQYRKSEIMNEEFIRKVADDENKAESENIACELDENYDSRIADIENALCELDERSAL